MSVKPLEPEKAPPHKCCTLAREIHPGEKLCVRTTSQQD